MQLSIPVARATVEAVVEEVYWQRDRIDERIDPWTGFVNQVTYSNAATVRIVARDIESGIQMQLPAPLGVECRDIIRVTVEVASKKP